MSVTGPDIAPRDDAAVEPTGRLHSTREAFVGYLRRIPFSIGLAVVLIVTAAVTGTMFGTPSDETTGTWAAGVITTVDGAKGWTIVTALFIPYDPFQLVFGVLAALLLLGVAERRMGTWRTLLAFVVTGAVGIAVGIALQWVGSLAGEWWASGTADDLTLDPLMGVVGALIAATAFMGVLWRRRIRIVVFAFIFVFVLYDGDSSNTYRLLAATAGLFLGAVLTGDVGTIRAQRSSHRETRTLVAAVVAVTAVGPIVALVHRTRFTPFSFGSYLYADTHIDLATVITRCDLTAGPLSTVCQKQLTLMSAQGFGMFLLSFLPVLLLLLAAWGLRKGRRFALWLAIAVNLAILAFSRAAFVAALTAADIDEGDWSSFAVGELLAWGIAMFALPVGVIVLLVLTRRHFQLRARRREFRRFVVTVVSTFVVLATAYFAVGLAALGDYWPPATPWDLLLDTIKRFVPPHFIAVLDPIVPAGRHLASLAYHLVGPLFWTVFIVGAVLLMRHTGSEPGESDRERLRELLRWRGGGTLGFMATWQGNAYWFTSHGEAAIAYRVVNGVAITMSDPICAPGDAGRVIRDFIAFCDAHSWVPVFYGVHPWLLPIFDELGWQRMSVGEETLVHLDEFDLTGKSRKSVRNPLNRGIREGMTTVWTSWHSLPLATAAEITAISEDWVAEQELPELDFTLGGLDELKDPDVRLMLALDRGGRVQAVTSWLPVFGDGRVIGWTLDFMRRADGSMNGIMEFLIASAALHMKEAGAGIMSLSGAPLASKPLELGDEPPSTTAMTGLLDFLAASLEPAYGFASLFRFKAKFDPDYETLSMAFHDPLAVPTIGLAIGRAYLPDISPKQAVALVRTLTTER